MESRWYSTYMKKFELYLPKKIFDEESDIQVTELKKEDGSAMPMKEFDPKNKEEKYKTPSMMIRLKGCAAASLRGREGMKSILYSLALACGSPEEKITPELLYLVNIADKKNGYTGEVRLPGGLIKVNTYPSEHSAEVDIFMRAIVDRATIIAIVKAHFLPKDMRLLRKGGAHEN